VVIVYQRKVKLLFGKSLPSLLSRAVVLLLLECSHRLNFVCTVSCLLADDVSRLLVTSQSLRVLLVSLPIRVQLRSH
jgi:hypothetical protein